MIRALEVAKITGSPLSHWQTQFEKTQIPSGSRAFVIAWDRSALHQRVEERVDSMFQRGLLEEVEQLQARYGALGRTASQAVGYKEPLEYFAGRIDRSTMVEQVKAHTRQFVRRQEIWFRSMPEIGRCPVLSAMELRALPAKLVSALEDRQIA
jgi:tRNA dimethylallyltransferase